MGKAQSTSNISDIEVALTQHIENNELKNENENYELSYENIIKDWPKGAKKTLERVKHIDNVISNIEVDKLPNENEQQRHAKKVKEYISILQGWYKNKQLSLRFIKKMFTAKKAFDNLVNETKSQNLMVGVVFHTLFALMYIAATYFYATNARHYFLPQKKKSL